MKRFSFSEILTLIVVLLTSVVVIVVLGVWTERISKDKKKEALREAMESVIKEDGEKTLFEMAGIPVDNVYYGEELLPFYTGEKGTWNLTKEEARNIAIYNKCKDSVVEIFSQSSLSSSIGTGVIISSDGYIVTNYHITLTSPSFTIVLSSGESGDARVVGYDTLSDISILKTDMQNLKSISFGSSLSLAVGQSVYAIGNPYGYDFSFTSGMISGLDRLVFSNSQDYSILPGMIQSDAMINPGNSGGPLLDSNGDMIALISSIYSTVGSAQGISFALPIENVKKVADEIIKNGKVQRGWLDVVSVELNSQIAEYSSLPFNEGILISQTIPRGKADKGGLRGGKEKAQYGQSTIYLGGDIITKINDTPIRDYNDLFSFLFSTHKGDKVDILVYRNGSYITLKDIELVEQNEENTKWILR